MIRFLAHKQINADTTLSLCAPVRELALSGAPLHIPDSLQVDAQTLAEFVLDWIARHPDESNIDTDSEGFCTTHEIPVVFTDGEISDEAITAEVIWNYTPVPGEPDMPKIDVYAIGVTTSGEFEIVGGFFAGSIVSPGPVLETRCDLVELVGDAADRVYELEGECVP